MNNKEIKNIESELLGIEQKIDLLVTDETIYGNNCKCIAKDGITTARHYLRELMTINKRIN